MIFGPLNRYFIYELCIFFIIHVSVLVSVTTARTNFTMIERGRGTSVSPPTSSQISDNTSLEEKVNIKEVCFLSLTIIIVNISGWELTVEKYNMSCLSYYC